MLTIFKDFPELVVGLSEKNDGNMKLSEPLPPEVYQNRKKYLHKLRIHDQQVVSAEIVHGSQMQIADENHRGRIIKGVDGLATSACKTFLSVTVADCLPIYFYDPIHKSVGMVHSGWRGLEKGIIINAISAFKTNYSSKPEDILVGIGPAIGQCHYAVGKEVADVFEKLLPHDKDRYIRMGNDQYYLDIKQVAKILLMHAGLADQHIEIHPACTFCETGKYFSYRRDKPEVVQAMVAVIGMGE